MARVHEDDIISLSLHLLQRYKKRKGRVKRKRSRRSGMDLHRRGVLSA